MLLQPTTGFGDTYGWQTVFIWNSGITTELYTHSRAHMHASTVTQMHTNARTHPPLAPSPPACKNTEVCLCWSVCVHTLCSEKPTGDLYERMWKTSRDFHLLWALYVLKYYGLSYLKCQWVAAKTWHQPSSTGGEWYFIISIICGWRSRQIIPS